MRRPEMRVLRAPANVLFVPHTLIHDLVGLIETFLVNVKGVSVLHDELTGTDNTESRSLLVSVLVLDLIKRNRQILVGSESISYSLCERLLMRRSEAERSAASIAHSEHLGAELLPSS